MGSLRVGLTGKSVTELTLRRKEERLRALLLERKRIWVVFQPNLMRSNLMLVRCKRILKNAKEEWKKWKKSLKQNAKLVLRLKDRGLILQEKLSSLVNAL